MILYEEEHVFKFIKIINGYFKNKQLFQYTHYIFDDINSNKFNDQVISLDVSSAKLNVYTVQA